MFFKQSSFGSFVFLGTGVSVIAGAHLVRDQISTEIIADKIRSYRCVY